MLKTSNEKKQNIVEKLYSKRDGINQNIVIPISRYTESKKQKISVSLHPSNHVSEYHTHDYFEVNYVCDGSCMNLVEDRTVIMNKGDLVILHPGAFHTLYADSDSKVINFMIDKDWMCEEFQHVIPCNGTLYKFLSYSESDEFYKYVVCPFKSENKKVIATVSKLADSLAEVSHWRYLKQEGCMLELLYLLAEQCEDAYLSQGQGMSSDKIIDILIYMSENYATVTLEILSEKFFYSKTHICRLFLRNMGKSFNQMLIDIRVSRASLLLRNTDLTVDEIAHAVGYDSVEYFQRLYKKKTGMTPGEYRKIRVIRL